MSDEWNFYFREINEKPSSTFVDLGIAESVPDPNLPMLLCVRVFLQSPNPDGLSSDDEYETLNEIEDALSAAMDSCQALYVGRVTTDGRREFFYYAPDSTSFPDAVGTAMAHFSAYRFETNSVEDKEWTRYTDDLHPNPEEVQCIENLSVIEALEENGDPLTAARDVQHWIYFANVSDRFDFIVQAEKLKFTVASMSEPEKDDEENEHPYGVCVSRVDKVDWNSINEVTIELFRLAEDYNGNYDGWETSVEKGEGEA